MNARGNDIYIRPEREHARGLVLLDNLSPAALAKLERDARGPALTIETSRENYQAWVRVPGRASEAERGEIGQRLSREYDAGPASISPRQYGRLAGFTNQKEIHRDPEGLPPFTLLRSATGRAAEDGELLLRQATRSLREQARAASRARPTPALSSRAAAQNVERAIEIFRGRFAELGQSIDDRIRCDFGAAVTLVDRGFDRATIAQAIRAESPDLEARKPGHVDDYVQRTAQAAILARSRSAEREGPERSGPAVAPDLERRKGSDVERYVRGTAKSAIEAQARELQRDRDRDQGWER
jgi:hypothetical protein